VGRRRLLKNKILKNGFTKMITLNEKGEQRKLSSRCFTSSSPYTSNLIYDNSKKLPLLKNYR